jgi:putative thioredoxin
MLNVPEYMNGDNPMEAALWQAIRLVKRGNIEAAADGLLDILRQDKSFRKGDIRRLMLALIELIGDADPTARQYRSELASILF